MYLLTKEQLMEALEELPDGALIRIAVPQHDHWRNVVASPISMEIEEVAIEASDYCEADVVCDPDGDSDEASTVVYLLKGTKG